MVPTRRLLLLLLGTALVAALDVFPQTGGTARPIALLLALGLVLVAVVDWWLARDLTSIELTRSLDDKLSLGEWNPVTLTLRSQIGRRLWAVVRDVPDPDFESDNADITSTGQAVDIPARETAEVIYRVRPRHRGNYAFGRLHVRAPGPLGLMARQRAVPGSELRVRVYPSLRGLRRYELMVRRGLAQEAGLKAIRVPGASTEFERLREYVPDDEYRRINWKATARRGKPIVNQFEAERSQNVVLMLDAGRLMGARAALPTEEEAGQLVEGEVAPGLAKIDYVVNAALLLAYVAGLRGDRVSLLAYADEVRAFLPPTRGRRAFLRVVDALYALQPEAVEPDHALAFQFLASRNLRRSLVVLFTDLADKESSATLVANLMRAGRHHLVVCVTLADPTVSRPGVLPAENVQSLYEKMVSQRLVNERAAVLAALAHRGVHTLDTDADKLSPGLIDAYLELKQRGKI
ncbi:MAG TPA: DUF58 domain-containing protein [Chloroflexota bacterium]|nr:DUF58 domain-containing protein [Chloroflexota bacterium]